MEKITNVKKASILTFSEIQGELEKMCPFFEISQFISKRFAKTSQQS